MDSNEPGNYFLQNLNIYLKWSTPCNQSESRKSTSVSYDTGYLYNLGIIEGRENLTMSKSPFFTILMVRKRIPFKLYLNFDNERNSESPRLGRPGRILNDAPLNCRKRILWWSFSTDRKWICRVGRIWHLVLPYEPWISKWTHPFVLKNWTPNRIWQGNICAKRQKR